MKVGDLVTDDFYEDAGEWVAPRLEHGKLQTGSLNCIGFGFDLIPDIDVYEPMEEWKFESLGLKDD